MTRITPVAELDEQLSYLKLHVHQGKLRNTGKTGGSKTVDACPIPKRIDPGADASTPRSSHRTTDIPGTLSPNQNP